jgi:hypothetical protein
MESMSASVIPTGREVETSTMAVAVLESARVTRRLNFADCLATPAKVLVAFGATLFNVRVSGVE